MTYFDINLNKNNLTKGDLEFLESHLIYYFKKNVLAICFRTS